MLIYLSLQLEIFQPATYFGPCSTDSIFLQVEINFPAYYNAATCRLLDVSAVYELYRNTLNAIS